MGYHGLYRFISPIPNLGSAKNCNQVPLLWHDNNDTLGCCLGFHRQKSQHPHSRVAKSPGVCLRMPRNAGRPFSAGCRWRCYGWWFQPLWKIWKSIGMIRNPIYGKIKNVNQTTNQCYCCYEGSKASSLAGWKGPFVASRATKDTNAISRNFFSNDFDDFDLFANNPPELEVWTERHLGLIGHRIKSISNQPEKNRKLIYHNLSGGQIHQTLPFWLIPIHHLGPAMTQNGKPSAALRSATIRCA